MAFSSLSFDGCLQGLHSEVPTYQGQPLFADLDSNDSILTDRDFVDAELFHPASMVSWPIPAPAMQRFLKDSHRPMLFNPMPPSATTGFGAPVTPMPPAATLHFHDSPPSSQEQSSCCSIARSPRTDTDIFTEGAPSTPPDMSFASSLPGGGLYDPFELHPQQFLTGMAGRPGDTFAGVSMAEINPIEESQNEWLDSSHLVDFNSPPQRSYTLDSHSSVPFEMDANNNNHSLIEPSYQSPGVSTPAKDEVSQPQAMTVFDTTKGPYPTPSIGESEDSGAEIDVATPMFEKGEDDDDDDEEYQPTQKQKSAAKRSAPSRPLDKASPKRQKAASAAPPPHLVRPLPSSSGSRSTFSCNECRFSFKDESSLQTHIKKAHTRPFICVFRFAGCPSTFASKNEWKRHVMSQHLVLTYWLCDIDTCAHNSNTPVSPSKTSSGRSSRGSKRSISERMISLDTPVGPPLPNGAIFNRKDLYTQHLRRMHTPTSVKRSSSKASKTSTSTTTESSGWEDQIKANQSRAHRERCKLPTEMQCPANNCDQSFSGTDAWDQRMEHVAKHLEKAATGAEDPVVFGGPTDPSLMAWVTSSEVSVVRPVDGSNKRWILNNPLRSASEGRGVGRRRDVLPMSSTTTTRGSIAPSRSVVGTSKTMSPLSSSFSACAASPPGMVPVVPEEESACDEIIVEEGDEDAEGEEE